MLSQNLVGFTILPSVLNAGRVDFIKNKPLHYEVCSSEKKYDTI